MINAIMEWLDSVLGTYTPVTYEVTVVSGEELVETYEAVANGFAGVDWRYLVGAALLLVTVYSVFRLLGVLMEKL